MATETDWNCPICRDGAGEKASVSPCLHQFCLGCIVRWVKRKPSCPLCRQPINTIIYSVRSEEDFLELVLPSSSDPWAAGQQDEQGAVQLMASTYVAGFPAELWAGIFQECSEILEPLLPWLNQELSQLLRTRWWEVALAQSVVVANLCYYGLSEEALVRELQPLLQEQTVAFVRQLIDTAADRCSAEILRLMNLLNSHDEEEEEQEEEDHEQVEQQEQEEQDEEEDGPTDVPASLHGTPTRILPSPHSPVISNVEADSGALEATLHGGPGRSPSVPVPAEQEQPQEEPGGTAAAAGAGPSAQGCSRSPCAPGRHTDCLPEEPRRPAKRKGSGPQDSPQPPKRPARQRRKKPKIPDCKSRSRRRK
ncbi:uncharacterized protein LOC130250263 [Oenanthe melanoleuca]|uniref:uncharacterized protein LOC130250263 n=1 Tax=Oenanthe melanoleuca TaxID=2939378 RepID=UPI0024C1B92A|nr:uncharacterized protein LOC130250263 [Oenanthe melanoleuca]